jgi:hypothetical protein
MEISAAEFEKLLSTVNALLDLIEERIDHDASYLRQRGIAPPKDDMRLAEFRERLRALRISVSN